MVRKSFIIACRAAEKGKWHYRKIYYPRSESLPPLSGPGPKSVDVLIDRVFSKDVSCHVDYMISRFYKSFCPFTTSPSSRRELRMFAVEQGVREIYWMTPGGQLWLTSQKDFPIYLARDKDTRLVEVRRCLGGFLHEHHRVLNILSENQERELKFKINDYFKGKHGFNMDFDLKKLLLEKGIIKPADLYDLPPARRISRDTQFSVKYEERRRSKTCPFY